MPLCTERFNTLLIVCCDCIKCFSPLCKSKMQMQEFVWDKDMWLDGEIKICLRYVGDDISDKVTCHRHLQIILNSPCRKRQNIPLLQHRNYLHANNSCIVNLPRLLPAFFKGRSHGRNKTKFLHCPSVCSHASGRLLLCRLRCLNYMLYWRHTKIFRKF